MAAKLSDIGKIIEQALKSKRVLEAGGEEAVESIKKRTRLGKGVKENLGGSHKLPRLTTKTVTNRKLLKKKGELTGFGASPTKSAINRSGDTIDNVRFGVGKGKMVIDLKSNKAKTVAQNLLKIDPNYAFMNLSKAEFNRMIKKMSSVITEILKGIKFDKL